MVLTLLLNPAVTTHLGDGAVGNDTTINGIERVEFHGGTMGDSATGGDLADELVGNGGADVLNGLGGDDRLIGDLDPNFGVQPTTTHVPGNDRLDGGPGADVMAGGPGDDDYWVDSPGDSVIEEEGEGHDIVHIQTTLPYSVRLHDSQTGDRSDFR